MLCQLSYTHHLRALTDTRRSIEKFGTPEGTRTPDPLLRRQLLYPPELQAHMERVMGIEPTRPAWKAGVLPLNYTRMGYEERKCHPAKDNTSSGKCQAIFPRNRKLFPTLSFPA